MKKFLLLSLSLVYAFIVYAGPVSENQALAKACQFMPGKTFIAGDVSSIKARAGNGTSAPYYVFNAQDNAGFVIVSGDDRTKAILGYSEKGSLNEDKLPENVKAWLEYYAEAISSIKDSPLKLGANTATATARTEIAPLIKSEWDQHSPWNDQCTFDGVSCVTGCVAIAMAQILNFHKYPSKVKAIDQYTCDYTIPALPATKLDWKNICDTYPYDETRTSTQKKAVAKLVRYCGQSVEMNYGPDGSAAIAEEISVALVKYFGYSKNVHAIYRAGYSPEDWEDEIYQELAAGFPLVYSGCSPTYYGHTFICDGYKDGLFHVNWGWGGWCDGYFVLTVMDSFGKDNINRTYSENQSAVVGIRPTTEGTLDYPLMTITELKQESSGEVTRNSTIDYFPVTISFEVQNSVNSEDDLVGFGIALYNDNTIKENILQFGVSQHSPGNYNYGTYLLSFGSGLEDGTYKIQAVYKDKDGNIHKTQGSDYRYIEAVVKGNKMTLTNYPLEGTVELSKSKVSIKKGKTVTLKATVSPSSLADKSVTWKSSDKTIATVTSAGKVKGVKYGTATITCTSVATGQSATCEVTVGNVTLDKSEAFIKKGKTLTLTAKVYPTSLTDKSVTWKSSDKTIATVTSAGKVKGVKYGTATITCTSKATGLSTTCKVTVGNVTLDKSEAFIKKGKTLTLTAKVYPTSLTDKSVTWKSSNTKIASVSTSGKVKGVKYGTATITCTSVATGLSTTCKVTVGNVSLDKSEASVKKGKTVTLKATVYPTSLTDKSVTWTSSNTKIATVSTSGKVKGVKAGTVTITCTSNATGLTATCKVTVSASASTRSLEGDDEEVTGIDEVEVAPAVTEPFDVYDLSGHMVAHQVTSLDGLPKGIYIVNGKKMMKKD